MSGSKFRRLVDWVVKLAVLVLQVPVTWAVAGGAFGDLPHAWVLRACAVLLADGVLLSNWLSLELDRSGSLEAKSRYVLGAWIQFAVMLVIALQHGEGVVGVAFRVSFAVALAGSTWDSIAATWARLRRSVAEGGAAVDWRVRLHHNRLDRLEAKAKRESEGRIYRATVAAEERLALARLDQDVSVELAGLVTAPRGDGHTPVEQVALPFGVIGGNGG